MVVRWMAAALALMLSTAAMAQAPVPTEEDVDRIRKNSLTYRSYPESAAVEWERDLRRSLARGTPQSTADALASAHGFSAVDSRRLVNAWIIANARHFATRGDQGWRQSVRAEILALAPSARQAPAGIPILVETLDKIEDCAPADFDALLAGSKDRASDAYRIANAAPCDGHFQRALLADPARSTAALIRWLEWGTVRAPAQIASYTWLTSPDGLARIDAADRPAMATLLRQRYIRVLLNHGFVARALALLDGLPQSERIAVLSNPAPGRATTGGIVMTIDGDAADDADEADTGQLAAAADAALAEIEDEADAAIAGLVKEAPSDDVEDIAIPEVPIAKSKRPSPAPILSVAAALAVSGRETEARAVLATLPTLPEAKAAAACLYSLKEGADQDCRGAHRLPMDALILDHWLNARDADPYPLAETVLVHHYVETPPANALILCRLFGPAASAGRCDNGETQLAAGAKFDRVTLPEWGRASAALARAVPGFETLSAAVQREVTAPLRPQTDGAPRAAVDAVTPNFAEKPLPAAFRGKASAKTPAGLTPLPEGFWSVRAERNGQRATAISLSKALDPSGEVSRGGYWVHLSEDGGKTWQRPLYTGLADRFPYVVTPSTMPLLAGNMLHLAVEIAELDTASITYPPVALRTRRRADNLYLEIPIARLKQDSDGDGLTDLAAHHVLLDRPKSAAGTPFIVGSDAASCSNAPPLSLHRRATIALLGKLANEGDGALVEPLDRHSDEIAVGWERSPAATAGQPLFLVGKPADFACLRAARPIIVYDNADLAELNRFTPDFRPFELPPIIFNRAGDRGFVNWSAGWIGGTYRFRLIDGEWKIDSIASWVT